MKPSAEKREYQWLFFALLLLHIGLVGCSRSLTACSTKSARETGRFCYGGIDFGEVDNPMLRQGIRDGCRTGRGTFTKNYHLSSIYPAYREGWTRGRAQCRPPGWVDNPGDLARKKRRYERYRNLTDRPPTRIFSSSELSSGSLFSDLPERIDY